MAQQRKVPECWFSRQLTLYGDDYISGGRLNEQSVKRNIDRIVNDIVNGNIPYDEYGYCVVYPAVFDTLVAYCNDKLVINKATSYSLAYTIMNLNYGNIRCDIGVQYDYLNEQPDLYGNSGFGITMETRHNIMVALEETNREIYKYEVLLYYLNRVGMTGNVYELTYIPNLVKRQRRR